MQSLDLQIQQISWIRNSNKNYVVDHEDISLISEQENITHLLTRIHQYENLQKKDSQTTIKSSPTYVKCKKQAKARYISNIKMKLKQTLKCSEINQTILQSLRGHI